MLFSLPQALNLIDLFSHIVFPGFYICCLIIFFPVCNVVHLQISDYSTVATWIEACMRWIVKSHSWFRPAIIYTKTNVPQKWCWQSVAQFQAVPHHCRWFTKWRSAVIIIFPLVYKLQLFWDREVENQSNLWRSQMAVMCASTFKFVSCDADAELCAWRLERD